MDLRFNIQAEGITDGDTVHVVADLGFKVYIRQIIRLAKINCPELAAPGGMEAREATEAWLHANAKGLLLNCHGQDKYAGRWVGTIMNAKGESLNQHLLDSSHAKQVK